MNEFLKKIIEKWSQISTAKKSAAIVMLVSLILASYFFFQWATRVQYASLFSNMEPESAGEVVEKLKAMNMPYRLSDEGRTILVPEDKVYDLRLKLASEGVFAGGGMGFELFDESRLGTTDFERRLNFQRALQEELRRTIMQLEAVEQARVHLVLPEKSVFIEEEGQASASIVVKLKPMATLQPEQVRGIVELVANSVESLQPEDVTIVDTNSRVLTDYLAEDFNAGYTAAQIRQMELKRNFERNLETRIQRLLERMYGNGKVVTMVTAELDFNQKEVTRIEWGDEGVVRSEQLSKEENISSSDSQSPVGEEDRFPEQSVGGSQEPGSIDTYPTQEQNNQNSSTRTESITNYEIDKTEEKIIYAPGRLISLSTAVAVDSQLPQEKVESIKKIVAAAIGYTPERGDKISVISMEFDKKELQETQALMEKASLEQQKQARIKQWVNWGFKAIGIMLAFILALVFIRTLGSIFRGSSSPTIQQPTPVQEVEETLQEKKPKDKNVIQQEKVQKIVEEKPEDSAQILKTWLADE